MIDIQGMTNQHPRIELGRVYPGRAKGLREGAPRRADRDAWGDGLIAPEDLRHAGQNAEPRYGRSQCLITMHVGVHRLRHLLREQGRLMLGHQRVDDLAQGFPGQHLRQLVEREIDTVVGHAPLRKL